MSAEFITGRLEGEGAGRIDDPVRIMGRPRLSLGILAVVVVAAAAVKLLDMAFVELNARKIVLPRFDVTLMPYHDPRFTMRHAAVSRYAVAPRVIFTGDSRTVNGVDPEVVAKTLGMPPESFFNFGTGSQVVSFVREAFLPYLLENNIKPEVLVFGVSPDWLLNKRISKELIGMYRNSLAYRIAHQEAEQSGVIEKAITNYLAQHVALYRYRSDLLSQEILLDLQCWVLRDCYISFDGGTMGRKEAEVLEGIQTRYGWNPQGWDGRTSGAFHGLPRFTEQDRVDREDLVGLIRQMREARVIPVFVVMPVHPSFRNAHEPAISRLYAVLEEVARREGADVLHPTGDYSDPKLFVDGHHLSRLGAAYFSADVAPGLLPYVSGTSLSE